MLVIRPVVKPRVELERLARDNTLAYYEFSK
jgi:hypothetical protein